jgi:hypothetical protein
MTIKSRLKMEPHGVFKEVEKSCTNKDHYQSVSAALSAWTLFSSSSSLASSIYSSSISPSSTCFCRISLSSSLCSHFVNHTLPRFFVLSSHHLRGQCVVGIAHVSTNCALMSHSEKSTSEVSFALLREFFRRTPAFLLFPKKRPATQSEASPPEFH